MGLKPRLPLICIFILALAFLLPAQRLDTIRINELARKYTQLSLPEFTEFVSLANDANKPEELEPNLRWLEKAFGRRGFDLKRLPTAGIDLLLAEKQIPGAKETVLFYVQVDGQPVDSGKWQQSSPYHPTLKERNAAGEWVAIDERLLQGELDDEWRIFARSASDAKGPINMFLAAWDAVTEAGSKPDYNIKLIMDTEEELGSPNLPDAVKKHREALAADKLVILDGPPHISNQPTLVFGARGIATVSLVTYGPRAPQHSGHYGNYVPNPALRLAQLLASMKDEAGRVTIPGFYEGVEINTATRRLLAAVPDDTQEINRKLGIAEADQVAATLQEALQYPSLNIRGLSAAWVGDEVRTIIPDKAVAEIDVRLVKESDPERLIGLIRRHIEAEGFHVTGGEPTEAERIKFPRLASMEYKVSYAAFRTDPDSEIGRWLDAALTHTFGKTPVKIRTHGGSVPISPFVHTLDVPAVIVPLVNPDNNQHSPNENLRLGNYFSGVKTVIGLLTERGE